MARTMLSANSGNYVYVETNPGTANPPAFQILRNDSPALWTANHRQKGCAGVHLRLIWNADLFANGTPNATFDVKGRKVYDPRTGLTVWSDNPALCVRDFLSNTDFGLGAPDSEIDDALVIAAANICDEVVSIAAGTEKRYTCNGSFQTSEEPGVILEEMLSSMAGNLVYIGGKWRMYAGAWRPPTVPALTDSDFRSNIQTSTEGLAPRTVQQHQGNLRIPEQQVEPIGFSIGHALEVCRRRQRLYTRCRRKGDWARRLLTWSATR
jgi:hypothetical protein